MGLRSNNLHLRIEREKEKNVAESYGKEIWAICIGGGIVLGIVAAICDFAVAYGMFLSTVKNEILAAGIALLIAGGIQWIMGSSFKMSLRMYNRGEYAKKGMSAVMVASIALAVLMFGVSAWLSFQPKQLVEGMAYSKIELKDEQGVKEYYDNKEAAVRSDYESRKSSVQAEIDRLNADKIMWRGKWTTRERSSRAAKKKSAQELPQIEAWYSAQMAAIGKERSASIDGVRSGNASTVSKTDAEIKKNTSSVIGISIGANGLRLIVLALLINFVVGAAEDSPGTSKKASPSRAAANPAPAAPASLTGGFSQNTTPRKAGFNFSASKEKKSPLSK